MIEVVIASAILLGMVLTFGELADNASKVSKVEGGVSDEQQNVRYGMFQLVREVRMAGAGGLPASVSVGGVRQMGVSLVLGSTSYGNGADFAVNNADVASDSILIGGTHHVRKGTDMIHVRGVIANAVYDLSGSNWTLGATTATLVINSCSKYKDPSAPSAPTSTYPCAPYAQNDLSAFQTPTTLTNRLFVISDTYGNVGIGIINAAPTTTGTYDTSGFTATVTLDVGALKNAYMLSLNLAGGFPTGMTSPSRGGILDDRVYFIDDGTTAPAAKCSSTNETQVPGPCHPVLSVADWVAGDTSAHPFSTATVTPIVEDIEDMQVAYGVDFYDVTNNAGTYAAPSPDGSISILDQGAFNNINAGTTTDTDPSEDASSTQKDEWLGNVTGELGTAGTYPGFNETYDLSNLKAVEVSIVAKGKEPDPSFKAIGSQGWSLMDSVATSVTADNSLPYHRRRQSVRINFRNFQNQ